MKSLQRYIETAMPYQCGFDVVVDGDENPLKEAVYVKKENRCGTLLEKHYFSATYQSKNKNWTERCIYCGTIDDLEEPYGAKDLVRRARKICPECNANQNLPLQLYGKRDFLLLKNMTSTLKSKAKKKSIHDSPGKSSVESSDESSASYESSDEEIRVNRLHYKRGHDKLSF